MGGLGILPLRGRNGIAEPCGGTQEKLCAAGPVVAVGQVSRPAKATQAGWETCPTINEVVDPSGSAVAEDNGVFLCAGYSQVVNPRRPLSPNPVSETLLTCNETEGIF